MVCSLLCHLNRIDGSHYSSSAPAVIMPCCTKLSPLVCTGSPTAALSLKRLKSFLAITELGYVCCSEPLLLTTSSAEYGLLIPSYRGDAHQCLTSLTCWSYNVSSAAPAFLGVGSNWYESVGRWVERGGSTRGSCVAIVLEAKAGRMYNFGTERKQFCLDRHPAVYRIIVKVYAAIISTGVYEASRRL